jgi:hypothetical protein
MNFVCKTCCKLFTSYRSLWRHGHIHKERKVKCECGLLFSRHDNLQRHRLMSGNCKADEIVNSAPKLVDEVTKIANNPNDSLAPVVFPPPESRNFKNDIKLIRNQPKENSLNNVKNSSTSDDSETNSDTSEDSEPPRHVSRKLRKPLRIRRRQRFAPQYTRRKLKLHSFQKSHQREDMYGINVMPRPTYRTGLGLFGQLH